MKKLFSICIILITVSAICSCNNGPKPEEILKKYEGYQTISPEQNKAKINIEKVMIFNKAYSIDVRCYNPLLNESKDNAGVIGNRLYVVNAENPAEEIPFGRTSSDVTLSKPGQLAIQQYHAGVTVDPKETKARYVLVCFKGIEKNEVEEVATPPLFFIVDLNKKEPKLLTDKIFLASELPAIKNK